MHDSGKMVVSGYLKSGFFLLLIGSCMTGAGCRDDAPEIEYHNVRGTIQEIDLQRRQIKLRFLHEETGSYMERTGEVPSDAEIFINGRITDIAELRVGEHILVKGRVEKDRKGGKNKFSAMRIDVTRDETVTFKTNAESPDPETDATKPKP